MCDLETLTADERALLSMYRALPPTDKTLALTLLPKISQTPSDIRINMIVHGTIINNKNVITPTSQEDTEHLQQ